MKIIAPSKPIPEILIQLCRKSWSQPLGNLGENTLYILILFLYFNFTELYLFYFPNRKLCNDIEYVFSNYKYPNEDSDVSYPIPKY